MIHTTQIVGLALVCSCICLVLRSQNGTLAMLLSLCGCVLLYIAALGLFSPVLKIMDDLRVLSGLSDSVTAPMLKATGIGVVAQTAASVCDDAGEKALGKAVEVCCSVMTLYVTIPLLSAVIALLKDILGGI